MAGVQKRKIWNLVISFVIVLLLGSVQIVLAGSVTLYGVLRYDGRPMSDITDVSPTIWGHQGITYTYDNKTGVYSISGLPSARVGIGVNFHIRSDRTHAFAKWLPGNYYVYTSADIPNLSLDERMNFDIGLEQIIHITSPWDNDAISPRSSHPPPPIWSEGYPEHSRCLYFAWDAVPGATEYHINISSIYIDQDTLEGYGVVPNVVDSYVQGTSFSTDLDLSDDFQFYRTSIHAYNSGGDRIGLFMKANEHGYGWLYNFRVVALLDGDDDCLSDDDELIHGTDPNNPDTDGDGLLDGREVDMAQGSGCPNPLDPDSDDDTLSDGDEVLNLGTNPCDSDTDGDGVPDGEDPLPKDPHVGTTVYVDDDATGANDGSSWADAYQYLQGALAAAQGGDVIRVAQGTYKPDQRVMMTARGTQVRSSGDRTETFQLIDGLFLKGGYAGIGEPDPDVRDIETYETILSGDLNGNDGPNFTNNGDNSYHVVTGSSGYAIVDGFTITAGNANGQDTGGHNLGGGIYNNGSFNLRLRNCVFLANSALHGGGIFNESGGRLKLFSCKFISNEANLDGGGMASVAFTAPHLTNCIFSCNSAFRMGGGIFNLSGSEATITNCTFSSNSAGTGGAIANSKSSSSTLTNCILWGNTTRDNTVTSGLQIALYEYSSVAINYCDLQGGLPGIDVDPTSLVTWGLSNTNTDPLFVDAANADYHLQASSPCIDAGDNTAIPASVVVDIEGNPRIINGIVDMGAYESGMSLPPPVLSEAMDTDLSFTTGGNADWFAQTTMTRYDGDAAQSGDISHRQDSWMQTTVSGAGTVKFYWKVSSEEYFDFLEFYIDGSLQEKISGSVNWEQKTYTISTSGPHTLEWRYMKDGSGDSGSDCGWVDKVEFVTN